MQRFCSFRVSSWIVGGLLAGTLGLAGCHHDHDDDHPRHDGSAQDVRGEHLYWDETRVVIRDDHGADHHGYYDRNGSWHGGFYDDDHNFHTDPADWARGREHVARKEGPADQYDRNGQDKGWVPNRH